MIFLRDQSRRPCKRAGRAAFSGSVNWFTVGAGIEYFCDGHHKKFDLGAVSERAHKGAKSVTPVCHHPRLDGPFAGLMETPNEQGQ